MLLTGFLVDTAVDNPSAGKFDTDGFISLREAVTAANTNDFFGDAPADQGGGVVDTITFDAVLTNQPILLGGAELTVNAKAVDADGNPLVYDQRGEGFARIFADTADIGAFEVQSWFVEIDVKPASDPNSINLASNGLIAVAIFTTDDFDASQVDAGTVVFAGASAVHSAPEDVDGDGDLDMVLHFQVEDTNLAEIYALLLAEDADASRQQLAVSLTGENTDGTALEGTDAVDAFCSGGALRELLDELALAGIL